MSVAILDQETVEVELTAETGKNHTETCLVAVESILKISKLQPSEIDLFACTIGPGSFTGLRAGIGTIKGLAFSFEKPVVGVSSLDALAVNVQGFGRKICSIIDARKKELYAAFYEPVQRDIPVRKGPESVLSPEALADLIRDEVVFVGDGVYACRHFLEERLSGNIIFADPPDNRIRAGAVGVIGLKKYADGASLSPLEIVPRYLRSSYAGGVQFD
jgi:tRNA threonylcarbamoyladenosine biosynthesis protein TsaB